MRALLFSLVGVVGCFHLGGETDGNHHNAEFSYSNCFLGCTTSTPMMLGDEEHVSVNGSLPDAVLVETSAGAVVSIASTSRVCCTNDADGGGGTCRTLAVNDACAANEKANLDIVVDALTVGSSDLVIKKSADGSVWDSVSLSVERAQSLALACNAAKSVTLAPQDQCPVTWKATDASGKPLMSTAGIDLVTSDGSVVKLTGFLGGAVSDIQATPQLLGDVSLVAIGAGDATVTATGGGATESLGVHVIP